MNTSSLIDALGGTSETARLFGVLPSAVSNWRAAGRFPDRLHYRVAVVCKERGIDLPNDFFDVAPPTAETQAA